MGTLITKFCHNEECGYVYTADPKLDVYAHTDAFCPNCQRTETYTDGDIPITKAEMPKFLTDRLIKEWWKNHHSKK